MANWNQRGPYEGQEPPNVISSYISGGQVVSCFVPYGVGVTLKMSRSGPQGVTLIPPTPPGAPPTSQLRQGSSSGSSDSWGSFGGASMTTPQRSQESQSSFGTNSSAFMNHTPGGGYAWTSSSQSTTPVPETPPSGNQFSSLQSSDWESRYLNSSTSGTSGPRFTSTMMQTPPPFGPRPQFGAPPPGPSSLSRASTRELSTIPVPGSESFTLRSSSLGDSGIDTGSPGSNLGFGLTYTL